MKSTELRIGNWVTYKGMFCEVKYLGVTNAGLSHNKTSNHRELSASYKKEIEHIPLTEEWAIKFGYECVLEMVCHFEELASNYLLDVKIEVTQDTFQCMSIHTLQNYWYYNTGEELTLTND